MYDDDGRQRAVTDIDVHNVNVARSWMLVRWRHEVRNLVQIFGSEIQIYNNDESLVRGFKRWHSGCRYCILLMVDCPHSLFWLQYCKSNGTCGVVQWLLCRTQWWLLHHHVMTSMGMFLTYMCFSHKAVYCGIGQRLVALQRYSNCGPDTKWIMWFLCCYWHRDICGDDMKDFEAKVIRW